MEYAQNDRYTRGWNKLKEIDGAAGEMVIAALAPIAPCARDCDDCVAGDPRLCAAATESAYRSGAQRRLYA
jgi:hypothetical protein